MVIRNRPPVALWLALVVPVVVLALPARANTWPLPPPGSRPVGQNTLHMMQDNGGSLEVIAKGYNVGFLALLQANPGIGPYVPRAGSVLTAPLQTLLPDVLHGGLVINLAELRLYYYPSGKSGVTVCLIGIGQLGGIIIAPMMVTAAFDKQANPVWALTANIRVRYKAMGVELPVVVPADPDSLMDHHAIRLAAYGGIYLLHGTSTDFDTGMRIGSSCIRLRNNDTKALYSAISPGAKVNIINTPTRVSVEPNGHRLIEVHQPPSEHVDDDPQTLPTMLSAAMTGLKQAP